MRGNKESLHRLPGLALFAALAATQPTTPGEERALRH